MDSSNRFAKLILQEDELPSAGTFYNFMTASFPNINEYLGLKPKKPFSHLGKSVTSIGKKNNNKGKYGICKEVLCTTSKEVCSVADKLSVGQSNEIVYNIKNESPFEFERKESSIKSHIPFGHVASTNLCGTIKNEPQDEFHVDMSMNDEDLFTHIKKELKTEPADDNKNLTLSELLTMTIDVMKPFVDKELPAFEVYPTFLALCKRYNINNITEATFPSIVEWKLNLFYFMRNMIQMSMPHLIDDILIKNLTFLECHNYFMMLYKPMPC